MGILKGERRLLAPLADKADVAQNTIRTNMQLLTGVVQLDPVHFYN